jgi:transcriptional regulator with XRE-family HTH domain
MPGRGAAEREFKKALGKRLAAMRHARCLPQSAVHRRTGLSVEYISRAENGHENPTILTLRKWAQEGLKTSLSELLKGVK